MSLLTLHAASLPRPDSSRRNQIRESDIYFILHSDSQLLFLLIEGQSWMRLRTLHITIGSGTVNDHDNFTAVAKRIRSISETIQGLKGPVLLIRFVQWNSLLIYSTLGVEGGVCLWNSWASRFHFSLRWQTQNFAILSSYWAPAIANRVSNAEQVSSDRLWL